MSEGSQRKSELPPEEEKPEQEAPLEILQEGREKMEKSAYVKILKKELKELKLKHKDLSERLKMSITEFTRSGILKQLDKNEEKQDKVSKEMQVVEDRIKKQMINSVKK